MFSLLREIQKQRGLKRKRTHHHETPHLRVIKKHKATIEFYYLLCLNVIKLIFYRYQKKTASTVVSVLAKEVLLPFEVLAHYRHLLFKSCTVAAIKTECERV